MGCADTNPTAKEAFNLQSGSHSWDVYIDGEHYEWNLAYSSYEELPMSNSDFGSLVSYRGDVYILQRAWSRQLQLTRAGPNFID